MTEEEFLAKIQPDRTAANRVLYDMMMHILSLEARIKLLEDAQTERSVGRGL